MSRITPSADLFVELQQLFSTCAAAGDAHDTERYLDCFTEDGTLRHAGTVTLDATWGGRTSLGSSQGREAIRAFRATVPRTPTRRHSLSNLRLVGEEDGELVCEQLVTVIGVEDAGPRVLRLATYGDRVRRDADGQLRIHERVIRFETPAETS